MKKDEILYLAVRAGVAPKTLERRGITPDATDDEIYAARLELAAIYTDLEYKWNRAAAAIHPDDEPETLASLRRKDDALDARIAQLMELKAVIERDIVKLESKSCDDGIVHIGGGW